ncbi:hypothetical protein GGI21_002687, partial [Coemansia aciculifera]
MSRATASNYLNPHLRPRSRSGAFEISSSSSSTGGNTAPATPGVNTAANAATISGSSKGRLGMSRPGATADRQFLHRPVYTNAGSGTDDERNAVLATSAAAGAAGRPRRMTHQATRLTIDPERAKAVAGSDMPRRTPVTATGAGSSASRRFLRTPSNQDLQQARTDVPQHSSEKDGSDGYVPRPRVGGVGTQARNATQQPGSHRPLQARLETSSGASAGVAPRTGARPPVGASSGAKPPTWRTQQAVRETDDRMSSVGNSTPQRTPATYTGVAGTKMAIREGNGQSSSSRGKTSDESKDDSDSRPQHQQRLRQVQSKPIQLNAGRNQNNMQSSASAIGIGSYNSGYQAPRPAHRAGAAASVIGATASSQVVAPQQAHAPMGQGVRPQIANYQQRYVAQQRGPSSVVSAAPAQQQPMASMNYPAKLHADQALQQQQPRPPTAPGPSSQSRSQSAAQSQSRVGQPTPE